MGSDGPSTGAPNRATRERPFCRTRLRSASCVSGRPRGTARRAAALAAHHAGLSWGVIGAQLDMTRQGARQLFERFTTG